MSTEEKNQAKELLDQAIEKEPKKKGCRRGCLIFVLIFGLPIWWNGCHTTSMRVSHETTRALGPMTSDGKRIDYFRAYEEMYYPPEMKTDDNGYRLIVRALGCPMNRSKTKQDPKTGQWKTIEIDPEPFRLQVYEKLGLDPDVPPTMKKIESPFAADYIPRYDKEHPQQDDKQTLRYAYEQKTVWTFDDFPMLEPWLTENTAGLDFLAETVRKPAFRIPFTRENENTPVHECLLPLDEVQMARDWARSLQARIQYRLGTGDIDGAIDDTITCHLLARHIGRHGTLVAYLVGIAIEGVATAVGIGENPEHPPTKEQIQRLLSELDRLPPRTTMSEAVESERFFSLAAIQDMYWGNAPTSPGGPLPKKLYPFLSWTVDINIMMERANEIYDSLVNQTSLLDEILEKPFRPYRLVLVRARSLQMMDTLASLFIPAMQAGREAYRRCECQWNMQHLTLALLLYEKDHGTMPEGDWREAVKPYLGADAEKYFYCPTHPATYEHGDETTYVMISGADPGTQSPALEKSSPARVLIAEAIQPQKLGEGDGRLPLEKAKLWGMIARTPSDLRPRDFDGLGSYHTSGLNYGFRNGSVRFISETISSEELDKLLQGTATKIPY